MPLHWWVFARTSKTDAWDRMLLAFRHRLSGVSRAADIAWLRRHYGFRLVKARIVLEPLTVPSPLPPAP